MIEQARLLADDLLFPAAQDVDRSVIPAGHLEALAEAGLFSIVDLSPGAARRTIAAIGRECTWRGVPPATVQLFDGSFITWRGIPIIPCNKIPLNTQGADGTGAVTSNILLMRVGEEDQGVIGLHQTGIAGEVMPSLSVRFMGINNKAVASYLVTKYFSCAALTDDSLCSMENVVVDYFHEYKHD